MISCCTYALINFIGVFAVLEFFRIRAARRQDSGGGRKLMAALLDIASWALLTLGGFAVLVGGIGALRMPDLYTRMHAASVTDSMGAILVISGLMLQAGLSLATIKLGIILLFLLLASPQRPTRWPRRPCWPEPGPRPGAQQQPDDGSA